MIGVRSRGLIAGATWLTVGLGASQAASLLVFVLAARSSDPAEYGRIMAVMTTVIVVTGTMVWGSNLSRTRLLAAGRCDYSSFLRFSVTRNLVFGLAGLMCALVVMALGGDVLLSISLGCLFLTANAPQSVGCWFMAQRDYRWIALTQIISRVCLVCLAVGLAVTGHLTAAAVPAMLAGTYALESLILVSALPRERFTMRWENPWRGAGAIGTASAVWGLQQLDSPLVALVAGPTQAGYYTSVQRWTNPLGLLATGFSNAALPHLAGARRRDDVKAVLRASLLMIPVIGAGALVIIALAPTLVPLLLGSQYAAAVGVLQVLALGAIPRTMNDPLLMTLQGRAAGSLAVFSTSLSAVTVLLAVGVLGSQFGALGAAWGWVLAQTITLGIFILAVRRVLRSVQS